MRFVLFRAVRARPTIGAPRNTPTEVIDKLNREINTAITDPKIKEQLADLGSDVLALSPGHSEHHADPGRPTRLN